MNKVWNWQCDSDLLSYIKLLSLTHHPSSGYLSLSLSYTSPTFLLLLLVSSLLLFPSYCVCPIIFLFLLPFFLHLLFFPIPLFLFLFLHLPYILHHPLNPSSSFLTPSSLIPPPPHPPLPTPTPSNFTQSSHTSKQGPSFLDVIQSNRKEKDKFKDLMGVLIQGTSSIKNTGEDDMTPLHYAVLVSTSTTCLFNLLPPSPITNTIYLLVFITILFIAITSSFFLRRNFSNCSYH